MKPRKLERYITGEGSEREGRSDKEASDLSFLINIAKEAQRKRGGRQGGEEEEEGERRESSEKKFRESSVLSAFWMLFVHFFFSIFTFVSPMNWETKLLNSERGGRKRNNGKEEEEEGRKNLWPLPIIAARRRSKEDIWCCSISRRCDLTQYP